MRALHRERHHVARTGWLRAAVLGANDGIVSTASLVVGVAAASSGKPAILLAGSAALVAGALSMAAGEYVSVSSQGDSEAADLAREIAELAEHPEAELHELTDIYVQRGLDRALAQEVASRLMEQDALAAHARDELSITELTTARPLQAALASAASFTLGAALPLLVALASPVAFVGWSVFSASLLFLGLLGAASAHTGGAPVGKAIGRVLFWGALAMVVTAAVGMLVGAAV